MKLTYASKIKILLTAFLLLGLSNMMSQDVDNDNVLDAVDLDNDNDGIRDTVECTAQFADYSGATNSGGTGPIETISGISFPSLGATADLTITENGGDLYQLSVGGPVGIFNVPDHSPNPNVAVGYLFLGTDNANTVSNDVDFVLTFSQPVYEITFHFRSIERSNYQFTGAQHTEQLVSSNAVMTYIPGTRTLDNTQVTPPEATGHGSIKIIATSPMGMTQIEWSLVENATNGDTRDDNLLTFSSDCDFDGDGIFNRFDLDSDNDGIYDVVEAGGLDADNDGKHDDDNGNTDNTADNGIPSEANFGAGITLPTDTLADGSVDFLNLDSDGDGCSDANEAYDNSNADGGDTGVYGPDPATVNANGLVTSGAPAPTYAAPLDTDTSLTADYQEVGPDDDGDGISNTCDPTFEDADNDGVGDGLDIDDDNDGILDVTENTLGVNPSADADGDRIPNYLDANDNGSATAPACADLDANGICDSLDPVFDHDADGVPNHFDLDSDNDGIPDNVEAQSTATYAIPVATTPTEYVINSGVNNAYLTTNGGGPGLAPVNTDNPADSIPDYLDTDSDQDTILDIEENGDTDNAIVAFADADGDGIDDLFDTVDNTVVWDVNDAVTTGDIANLQLIYGDFDDDAAPTPVPLDNDLSFRDNCQITAGVIAAEQTICTGGDPAAFTVATAASVDSGVITYQWQISTTSATAGFADIGGATTDVYNSGVVTQDSWFRRVDTNTFNSISCSTETNVVAIIVNDITAGVIAADETVCDGGDPTAFTVPTATVADGTITYQWQSSTAGATGPFANIGGATNDVFDSPALTQDTWFRRIDTSTLNTVTCTATTNVIAVTVNNITAGIIEADQTICEGGDPVAFTQDTAATADGVITHQWQSSTAGATGPFANISGAVNTTYDSPSLTQDTWFRRLDISTLNTIPCSVPTNVIAVTVNNITAGVIAADETICEGDDPIAFTETNVAIADGTVTYQWQSSTAGATGPFADISGATSVTYDSPALTQDTWFQRVDTSTLNTVACTATTNVIEVTVNNITAGVIAADETICEGGDPIAFTETTGTVADGMITYQWQSSTAGATGPFADISGATSATYNSPALTQDTWFQRVDTSTLNTIACTATTNVIAVTVNNITAGVIAADETICEGGDPVAFTETTPTVADGTVTYQWQSSTAGATGPFADISGATSVTYDSPALTQDTWFQRVDTSTLNTVACTATTNVIAVTVNNITAGVIAADETICEGGDPVAFTEATAAIADGTITYQWQSSTTGATGPFTDIVGANSTSYDSPALTQDTWFQRIDTSTLNTIACTATTNIIAVSVNDITAGVIAADETICEGGDPVIFTETTATVADGVITYQWQSSTAGATGPFNDIVGANSATYDSPALSQDTWFQRVDTSTFNTVSCSAITNVIEVTVNNIVPGVIAADQIIVSAEDPVAFTETTATVADGTITYQWQSSTVGPMGPFTDIVGATGETYDSPPLTEDTWFQRVDISELNGVSCSATTNVLSITLDSDSDGIPDAIDLDDDNDGITDEEEQNGDIALDTDIDGIVDRLDLDADGDGVNDIYESGHGQLDMDGDGRLEGPFGTDGIPDVVQDDPDGGVVNYAVQETDRDGIDDFQDTDDDGDNVLTADENPNPDGDGDPETGDTQDSDIDGIYDYLDIDDDNDGVYTVFEDYDADDNPINEDTDGDLIPDYLDVDDDGDGVHTQFEGVNPDNDGNPNTGDTQDTDCAIDNNCDNVPDYLDNNDDGDPFLTEDEEPDPNGDGDPEDALDTDENGIPNYLQPDNDDSILDRDDGVIVYTGMSPNGDGINDVFIIGGIQDLENRVEIFNRWGGKVFESDNYGRDGNFFDGISSKGITPEKEDQLPVGTYYYVLEYVLESGERKSRAGYLYINR